MDRELFVPLSEGRCTILPEVPVCNCPPREPYKVDVNWTGNTPMCRKTITSGCDSMSTHVSTVNFLTDEDVRSMDCPFPPEPGYDE